MANRFHTWAVASPEHAGCRIEVASDASLDEGAVIRTVTESSPLSSGVEYFLGLQHEEAEIVKTGLQSILATDAVEDFDAETVHGIIARLERLMGHIESGDTSSDWPEDREIPAGTRVVLTQDVERYPHFIAPAGSTGTVVDLGDDTIFAVRLDEHLPGAEEWHNEVHWSSDWDQDHTRDIRPMGEEG